MNLTELTAVELGRAIRQGEATPLQAVEACLARSNGDPHNTWITRTDALALERAAALKREGNESVLFGVPAGVKDNICTENVPTTCASHMLKDFVSPYNATVMERFYRSGSILLGKLNMDEFAMGSTSETGYLGSVKNPWNPSHSAGGSSGGAAAAVAAGECFYALASDTGGSIRQPAAHCGVTGLKPTYGTVSRYGLVAYASSLEQVGPIACTAEDCACVLDALRGWDGRDSTCLKKEYPSLLEGLSSDLRGVKVGLPRECFGEELDGEVRSHILGVAEGLKSWGAEVEWCSLPVMDWAVSVYYVLSAGEASSNLARYDGVKYGHRAEGCRDLEQLYCRSRTEGFGGEVRRRILLGTFVLSEGYYEDYYQKALRARRLVKEAFDGLFARYHLLLTPVTAQIAPKLGQSLDHPAQMYQTDRYTVTANLAGLPALSMPCGFHSTGLPIGAQLIAPAFGEQLLVNAAHAWQSDTGWHRCRPEREVE